MKIMWLLAAVFILISGNSFAEQPKPVAEQNLDENGNIKVAVQNSNTDPLPVDVQGTIDANITSGQLDANVVIDSIPNVVIESMPPILDGDHPALTSFSQRDSFNIPGGQIADMTFNDAGNKVCYPGDKMIITTITGDVHGELKTPTAPAAQLPLSVRIIQPVLYHLSDSSYSYDGFVTRYSKVWNEKTNIIMDADYQIVLSIWQGPTFGVLNTWYGSWSIFGYCFTP